VTSSPTQGMFAATYAGTQGILFLWTGIGKLVRTIHAPGDYLTAVTFSPDGKTLLTGSHDGVPRLWDVETGEPRGVLCPHQISRRYSVFGGFGFGVLVLIAVRWLVKLYPHAAKNV
jgi:WD40 repeat protein